MLTTHNQVFTYDAFDRIIQLQETISGRTFTTATEYDALGREKKHTYPSGFSVTNTYGNLTEVKDQNSRSIYKLLDENARGQLTKVSRNGKETTFGFDSRGLLISIVTPSVINFTNSFDSKGNLEYRIDTQGTQNGGLPQKEALRYDGMNRLTNWDYFVYPR